MSAVSINNNWNNDCSAFSGHYYGVHAIHYKYSLSKYVLVAWAL